MNHTKDSIIKLLATNDEAILRALVALNARQTKDEQVAEDVKHRNGMGFKPCHARMGCSMAKQIGWGRKLTDKQIAYWRKLDTKGKMRIACYAGQLLIVAEEKAALAAEAANLARRAGAFIRASELAVRVLR